MNEIKDATKRQQDIPCPWAFHGVSNDKDSACSVGDLGLIPGLGRYTGAGHNNPLQYFCLENPHGQRSPEG